MAERSFAKEVEDLKLGDGQEFHGEGILAITKALLQSGVGYVAGYQGAPISHLMDVLSDAQDILSDLGVHFETSASEATAAATLAASVMYPIRGAVTFKSPVGTNVASDALANLASGGRHRRRPDHRRRGLRRGLLDHAGAQPRLRDEIPDLAARSPAQSSKASSRRRDRLRTVGGVEHAGHAGAAHPRLPCQRQLPHQDQSAADDEP